MLMKLRPRATTLYCLLAGACDGLTGLMLLAAPLFTLQMMRISPLPAEPIYMRWIGAFVFSVGSSYGLPFIARDSQTRHRRLISMLEMTAWIRVCIGLFVAVGVATQQLAPGWITVAITDGALAAAQFGMLKRAARDARP